jgi:carboxymethylenebutenolidase
LHRDIRLPVAEGRTIAAHLALPEGDGGAPAILVLHEILGLNDDIRRIAQRFAREGFVALAPDLFEGRGPKPICIVRTMAQIRRGEGPAIEDMLVARDWLVERDEVDGDRVGVAGFCMGGGFALLLGSIGDFKVAAPFYGDARSEASRYRDICPVVGGWGAEDRYFAAKGRLVKRHLEQLGVPHDIEIYEDAGHSYMSQHARWMMALAPFTPLKARYNHAAAEDSWRRMREFFAEHL